jgi:hypothetical protein
VNHRPITYICHSTIQKNDSLDHIVSYQNTRAVGRGGDSRALLGNNDDPKSLYSRHFSEKPAIARGCLFLEARILPYRERYIDVRFVGVLTPSIA